MIAGQPSIPYGVVRRLAHLERRQKYSSYLRIILGGVGRNGGHGGLDLEVNGNLYRFHHNVKSYPAFHDGSGHLTMEGKQALASGLPGVVDAIRKGDQNQAYDWHWAQGEIDLTHRLTVNAITAVGEHFQEMALGRISPPMYQSRRWAENLCEPIKPGHHNCVTIIMNKLREVSDVQIDEELPRNALILLREIEDEAEGCIAEQEFRRLLCLSEEEVLLLLNRLRDWTQRSELDWKALAKGQITIPNRLTLSSLIALLDH